VLAHANAVNNPNAMYRKAIRQETYEKAEALAEPVNLFDLASYADGAAAVILTTPEIAANLTHPLVTVRGSAGVIDTLAIHDRPDPLAFDSARYAVQRACEMGGILPGEVDLFELDDAFSIYAVLGLEAAGFAERGEGWRLGQSGDLALNGRLPVMTMGGSKGRGNPLAATGVYQIVEAASAAARAGWCQPGRKRPSGIDPLAGRTGILGFCACFAAAPSELIAFESFVA
jgi:acetyl-CoA C-acetyltransferase